MIFKICLSLIDCGITSYCLKYREWIEDCPVYCPYYSSGRTSQCEEYRVKGFDIACIHLQRKKVSDGEIAFYCTQLDEREPQCKECTLAEYIQEP
ncbi:MAG: hypothetical protein ACTSW1_06085 [Candidatus Hodarchaeales archaeon]